MQSLGVLGRLLIVVAVAAFFLALFAGWRPAPRPAPPPPVVAPDEPPLPPPSSGPGKPSVRAELTEDERKAAFREVVSAFRWADFEAAVRLDLPRDLTDKTGQLARKAAERRGIADKFDRLRNELAGRKSNEIIARYGITDEELTAIIDEGARENWPR